MFLNLSKKAIAIIISAVLAVSLCLPIFAADYHPDNGSFTVTYTDGVEGNFYSLLVVEGDYMLSDAPEFTVDNIIYINQATAGANGYAEFVNFAPMRDVLGTVYLGGTEFDAPILLGRLAYETMEFVYDGNRVVIEYNGDGGNIVVPDGVKKISSASVFESKNVTAVRFPLSVTELVADMETIKQYVPSKATVDFSGKTLGETIFIIGDFDNDGAVTVNDLKIFIKNRAGGATVDELQADINGNGLASLGDLSEMMKDLAE